MSVVLQGVEVECGLDVRTGALRSPGRGGDLFNFVWVTLLFAVIMYFIADFMIKKFNLATAGRNGNYDGMEGDEAEGEAGQSAGTADANSQIVHIINLLGGKENIVDVDACMTRLRVTVKDSADVADEESWSRAGAVGLILKGNGVQAVYGPKADVLKSDRGKLSHLQIAMTTIACYTIIKSRVDKQLCTYKPIEL